MSKCIVVHFLALTEEEAQEVLDFADNHFVSYRKVYTDPRRFPPPPPEQPEPSDDVLVN